MTDPAERFPEPRRTALRTMLLELTADGAVGEQTGHEGPHRFELLDGHDSVPPPRHGAARRVAAVGAVLVAAAAVLAVVVLLMPAGRDDARVPPAATTTSTPPSPATTSGPAHAGLYVDPVTVSGTGPAEDGWTVSSCPYLDGADPAGLLGTGPGPTWSAVSTPVRCRVFTATGAPLLDVTTFGEDGPDAAAEAATELQDGAVDLQAPQTRTGDPTLDAATVTVFRTDGLTGHDLGWAATITQGSTAFLVRGAASLDRAAVERVADRVVEVATGPGGSALTSSLRLCSHDLGVDFAAAFIGGQVTCSFGGDHATAVSAQYAGCPDGEDVVVFWSTAADATDHATYYGRQGGLLMSTPAAPAAALTIAREQACR